MLNRLLFQYSVYGVPFIVNIALTVHKLAVLSMCTHITCYDK